jgi:hypothetical protein
MNCNPQQFTRKELADFYEQLILLWENGDLLNQSFNVRSGKSYRRLKEKFDFEIKVYAKLDDTQAALASTSLTLDNDTRNCLYLHNAKSNILKSYFYHIRNVAGHADIKKVKYRNVNWYVFEHSFNKQVKLFGTFKVSDFWKVHQELIKLKRGA